MQIKRDYSQPFFGQRRRKTSRALLFVMLLMIAGGLYIISQREQIPAAVDQVVDELFSVPPTPTPLPGDLATEASQLQLVGKTREAVALYERALEQRPDNIDFLYEYGMALLELDRFDDSLVVSEKIIDLAPMDARGFALKAQSMVWLGDSKAAIPVALAGIENDSNVSLLYSALAWAYSDTERWRDGLENGERAVELSPYDVYARRAYAQSLTAVAEYELAIEELLMAIELRPTYLPSYFEVAALYMGLNRDREAIDTYNQVLSIEPRNARALLRQCQVYRKIGEFQQALGQCQDAVAADPDYRQAQFQLGALYYRSFDFENARIAFQACVDIDSSTLDCVYRLGLSHYYLGDCEIAWEILQDSLQMALSQVNRSDAVEDIRAGLDAIASDERCFGSDLIPTPTPETDGTTG